jgi:signal transduction histidine kinase
LVAGYEQAARGDPPHPAASGEQRIDLLVADVIRALRLSTRSTITLEARPVTAAVDRLALWRVLRNLLCNALQAADDDGQVEVRVFDDEAGDVVVIEIDDDGPGYEPGPASPGSLGLRIVRDLVRKLGGRLFISSGALGGCGVRLFLDRDGAR